MQEYEGTYIDIDVAALQERLRSLGATHVGDYNYRRIVFDYADLRLDKQGAWVRLRDEGDQITLSYKQRIYKDDSLGHDDGMIEHEVVVSDFDTTSAIIKGIGLVEKFYIENKRTRFELNGIEYDFDTWPLLDTYLEIETDSDERVDAAAKELGLDPSTKLVCSTTQIYEMKGIRDKDYQILTFDKQVKKENQ